MSAAARAEARKKAILSRGSDRLAKLTSSARGEEAASVYAESPKRPPVSVAPDPPLPTLGSFVGEEPPPTFEAPDIIPQQLLADILAANKQSVPPAVVVEQQKKPTSSKLQKFLPLLHWLSVWALLLYFIIWIEPRSNSAPVGLLDRWGALLKRKPDEFLGISIVPFFWAFTTLQVLLHSLRIFGGFDSPEPPTLLAFVLPHLPPPFPVIITTALKYLQIGGYFLDDLALLIVGIGVCVWIGSFHVD